MKKILFIIPILFLLTGCYNYRELNDLAIVSGVSISMEEDEYKVTLEIVNPKKDQDTSNANEPDFIIYTSKNKSIQKAFREIVKESPRKVYAAQIDILIIDESVAKEDLKYILDFLSRDPEIRSEFYVLISKENEILEVTTPLENISSKNILDSMKSNNNYLGTVNLVTYHDLISNYLNENVELALPSIEVTGNETSADSIENTEKTEANAASVLSNIAIFKNNKFLGYLTEEESISYNFIMGNIKTTLIETNYENDQFVVNEIINTKTKMEAKPKDNKITITIDGKASISEANCKFDLEKSKTIEKIETDLNNKIEKMLKESITNIIEKYNSDIFGFQDLYYKTDPKYFKEIKDKWHDEYFNNIEIEVKSKINIFEKGNLNGVIYNEKR